MSLIPKTKISPTSSTKKMVFGEIDDTSSDPSHSLSTVDNIKFNFTAELEFLQSVFTRMSWRHKRNFLKHLITSVHSNDVLKAVMFALGSLFTKDVIYFYSQNVNAHTYDCIPQDNDRSLLAKSINQLRKDKLTWFLEVDERFQEKTLLALLRSSGGACMREMFSHILMILNQPRFSWVSPETKLPSILPGYNSDYIRPSYNKQARYSKISETNSSRTSRSISSKPRVHYSSVFNLETSGLSTIVVNGSIGADDFYRSDIFINENIKKTWREALDEMRQEIIATFPRHNSTSKNKDTSKNDKLQFLPVMVNARIISFLDRASRDELKKVNEYWNYMVDVVDKEETEKAELNKLCLKLKAQYVPGIVIVPEKVGKGKKSGKLTGKGKKAKEDVKLVEVKQPVIPVEMSNEAKLAIQLFKTNLLNGRYDETMITDSYHHNRMTVCTSDGKFLIMTGKSHMLYIHSLKTGCQMRTKLLGHAGFITCLANHPDGYHIVSGSVDATTRYWNLKERTPEHIFLGHTKRISSVAVNDEYVVSASHDKTVVVNKIKNGIMYWTFQEDIDIVTALLISENDNIYTGLNNGFIKKYSLRKKQLLCQLSARHSGKVTVLLISKNYSNFIVSAGDDGLVHCVPVFELNKPPMVVLLHGSPVTSVTESKTGYLITGCQDGRLRIWDPQSGILLRVIRIRADLQPIRNVHYFHEFSDSKIIITLDSSVFVYEFRYRNMPAAGVKSVTELKLKTKEAEPPKTRSISLSTSETETEDQVDETKPSTSIFKSKTRKEQRLAKLRKRFCTLPIIRDKHLYDQTNSSVLLSAASKNSNVSKSASDAFTLPRIKHT